MQTARESSRQRRCNKRRNSRKKSLSPSDLKCVRDRDLKDNKLNKRSLSEGSVKVKHKKSNIKRTLTHPITCVDVDDISVIVDSDVKPPLESDESNLPPTSSDRDTEDDGRVLSKPVMLRPRWDSGSEMDSLVSTVVRRARRRRTPVNPEWGVNYETGEASEPEGGRMRPEDYRLVFLSSDSSCREDTEDSSSTASSAAPPAPDDCDWDYFEPGAAASRAPACPRACSCGAEPRIVAVPVPVPVPVPAALWPALLAFPAPPPPAPHWHTYPGFPPLDAAAFATLTTAAAAVAVTAAATATANANTKLEMTTVERTDKAIQSEAARDPSPDNDNDKSIEPVIARESTVDIEVVAVEDGSPVSDSVDAMPEHLDAERAFPSSGDSSETSDSERGGARRSYEVNGGAPDEPATSDEDSEDSGGGGGGRFSRVYLVNPVNTESEADDSSGIDCDDSYDRKSDSLEIIVVEAPPPAPPPPAPRNEIDAVLNIDDSRNDNSNVVLLESINYTEEYPVVPFETNSDDECNERNAPKSEFIEFCDKNMLQSEMSETFNSFIATTSSNYSSLDNQNNITDNGNYSNRQLSQTPGNEFPTDNLDSDTDMKLKLSVELLSRSDKIENTSSNDDSSKKLAPSPEPRPNSPGGSPPSEKIDLFKGIERTLSELLKRELLEEQGEEKMQDGEPVCKSREGSAGAPVASAVSRSRTACADGSARFTSRVMITHDRVSVVTSDTTRVMRDVTVHHTNSQDELEPDDEDRPSDEEEAAQDAVAGGVTVVSNADTLSAVVCLEEGLADDDSWVEDVSQDEDDNTSPTDSDSGDEASLPTRGEDFAYCRRSIDFTLHTIVEESCEESETEQTTKKPRPISATELEKYFFFGLGDGRNVRDDEEAVSETSSVCSEGGESIVDNEQPKRNSSDNDDLVSSRLEKYFLSGFMGFNQERRDSDGSGSVGSDSEGRQSPEQRRKRLVRARGTPRSHSSSLDNLLTGDEPSQDAQEISDASSTEAEDRHDSSERLDMQGESKRKKQNKKPRGSPADERRQSAEFAEESRDDTRSVSEGEDGRASPRPEFPPLGSELSESKKQTSRDSGFVGSCDDLLRNGDSSSDFARSHEPKIELEEIVEEIRPDVEERLEGPPISRPPQTQLSRKDSFNNWSSDEETNLMMTKMRQFFKQMINSSNVRTSTPASSTSNSESPRPPKPPQLLYFESELTRLMKTVPGIRDEEVREIVEYLSSEDTWSDSYDSSDYAGSDLEGTTNRSALRKQISESCREIIDKFDNGNNDAGSLERDAAGAYRRLAATLGRAGEGSPPLFGKVMRHIGGRLVALMHEVSAGASPSTDDDSASEPGALARSKSHDILEAAASRGSVASDCERFSWRGSFESALLAADSRGTLGGGAEARRSPAGVELAAQRSHSRSCGAIGGSEDRLWRGRRRASAPDAESEEEQRSGSLPRLPSITGPSPTPPGPVKSARYRAPGFRTATRAASAPGLHAPRRRRPVPTPQQPSPAAPASAPSLQGVSLVSQVLGCGQVVPKNGTMVADNNISARDNRSEVKDKKSEVSCWNCFKTVVENDVDAEPATLPKIRLENRQKYKLYSFIVAQISRPRAVPLAQKVSENYAIGKKLEKKITEKAVQTDLSEINNITKSGLRLRVTPTSIDKKEGKLDPEIKKIEISSCLTDSDSEKDKGIADYIKEYNLFEAYKTIRRKSPTPILSRRPIVVPRDDDSFDSSSLNFGKLEIVQPKVTIRKLYESPSIHITSSTYITNSHENLSKNTSPVFVRKLNDSSPNASNSLLNKSEPLKFTCESLKIQQIKDKYKLNKKVTPMKQLHRLSSGSLSQNASTNSIDNIHNAQGTSTPKTDEMIKPEGKRQADINKIIEGMQNISLLPKELSNDKEIASSNCSESGYSGSSVRDLNDLEIVSKIAKSRNDTESPPPKSKFKSSLPVLVSRHQKEMNASTKSLAVDSSTGIKKPEKRLRWSTFDLAHRYEYDEVYMSDNIPSGHATLPRRSNSPLPHERDSDRDRFGLNRSGLQTRSESMASVYSGAGEGTRANVTVRGEVQFSLLYNYRLGALEVGVKRCRDLAPVDTKRNRSDPYVKVYLLPDKSKSGKRKTKVKKNTLNPVFEESLSFAQPLATLSTRTLWLSVWHADIFGRNDFLGEVTLPLADVVFDDPAPQWYKLHERTEQFDEQQGSRGDLIIGLKFELHESGAMRGKGTLHVLIKEAKNLVATKPNGLADVFCKSYLLPERGRLAKKKTGVVRRSLSPVWEQTFTYPGLRPAELSTRALELSLWDRDRLASNEFMGAVRLSLGTGTYMGANVNWMDSTGKEVTLWQTMMQRPNFWVEGSVPLRPQLSN